MRAALLGLFVALANTAHADEPAATTGAIAFDPKLAFEPVTAIWPGCYLVISKGGDIRVEELGAGGKLACIEALERAARLERAAYLVNQGRKKGRK